LWDYVLGIKLLSYRKLEMVETYQQLEQGYHKEINSQRINCQLLMDNETLKVTKFRI
jgi:hypothetical protein